MTDVLNPDALHQALDKIEGWSGTVDGVRRDWKFGDFSEAMQFVNRVADLAEEENHHPDIAVSYNRVSLTLVTHSAGGVTQKDLDMAERINTL